jgi:hypothetical protein
LPRAIPVGGGGDEKGSQVASRAMQTDDVAALGTPRFGGILEENTRQHDFIRENYVTECARRIRVMQDFFGVNKPDKESSSEWLIITLCNYWEIPAFQVVDTPARGPGRSTFWTDEKNCQLFADVMALNWPSENASCAYIAKNPRKYRRRYGDLKARTLHRQFLRAKDQITHNPVFRLMFFSAGGPFEEICATFQAQQCCVAFRAESIPFRQYRVAARSSSAKRQN